MSDTRSSAPASVGGEKKVLTLSDRDEELVRGQAAAIQAIQKGAGPGAAETDLRLASSPMRTIADYFAQAWRILKMEPRAAAIAARKLHANGPGDFAFISEAKDTEVPEKYHSEANFLCGPAKIIVTGPNGEESSQPIEGGDVSFIVGSQLDPLLDWNLVYTDHSFPLHEYWDSLALRSGKTRVSRVTIIRYIANRRGGNHSEKETKPSPKEKIAYAVLDHISKGPGVYGRDPVFLSFMSICQEFTRSEDVQRFVAEANTALGPRRRR